MKFKNVMSKLLAGVLAVGMAAWTVPVMAEETSDETIEMAVSPSYFADFVAANDVGDYRGDKKLCVNTYISNNISMYNIKPYAEFEIPYVEYAQKAVLKVYANIRSDRDTCARLYVMTDGFADKKPDGEYGEGSDEYVYYNTYLNNTPVDGWQVINYNTTFAEPLEFTTSGNNQSYLGDVKLDYSDSLAAAKTNGGKLAFRVRGGANATFNLDRAQLLVTYDKAGIESGAVAELEGAYTADAIAAFVSNYNGILFNIDTNAVFDVNAVYAKLAAQNQTTTFESIDAFVKAYKAETASLIKTVKYVNPTNYAILNRRQILANVDAGKFKALVNTLDYTRSNGNSQKLDNTNLYLYPSTPVYNYKITNTDAVTDISFMAYINNETASQTNMTLKYMIADEFPVPTQIKEYEKDSAADAVYTELTKCVDTDMKDSKLSFAAPAGKNECKIDLNNLKEQLKAKEESRGYANILFAIDFGGGKMYHDMTQTYLQVTYDTSVINSHFESEVEGAVTADAMKAVVEKYNEFIGADTSALINMNYVYTDLANEVSKGKSYTYETLKADFDKFVKNYLVDVTYTTPNNYIMYRNAARQSFNGKYTEPRTLLNSLVGTVDNANDPYYGKKWEMNNISLFHIYPILGYDIENTQAVTKVVYNIGTRNDGTGRVYYTVNDSFPLSGTAGEYMADTAEYAAVTSYWDTKKQIGDYNGEVDITSYVLPELKKNNSATLVMSQMNGGANIIFDIDKTTLTVTYDITAIESDSQYDYDVSARLGEYYAITPGAEGTQYEETTAVRNTTVEASITANRTTQNGYTAICAAYKDGELINVKMTQESAMNIMGRTKISFEDFTNCDYDTIKVFVLDGTENINPLAINAEMTKNIK